MLCQYSLYYAVLIAERYPVNAILLTIFILLRLSPLYPLCQ